MEIIRKIFYATVLIIFLTSTIVCVNTSHAATGTTTYKTEIYEGPKMSVDLTKEKKIILKLESDIAISAITLRQKTKYDDSKDTNYTLLTSITIKDSKVLVSGKEVKLKDNAYEDSKTGLIVYFSKDFKTIKIWVKSQRFNNKNKAEIFKIAAKDKNGNYTQENIQIKKLVEIKNGKVTQVKDSRKGKEKNYYMVTGESPRIRFTAVSKDTEKDLIDYGFADVKIVDNGGFNKILVQDMYDSNSKEQTVNLTKTATSKEYKGIIKGKLINKLTMKSTNSAYRLKITVEDKNGYKSQRIVSFKVIGVTTGVTEAEFNALLTNTSGNTGGSSSLGNSGASSSGNSGNTGTNEDTHTGTPGSSATSLTTSNSALNTNSHTGTPGSSATSTTTTPSATHLHKYNYVSYSDYTIGNYRYHVVRYSCSCGLSKPAKILSRTQIATVYD